MFLLPFYIMRYEKDKNKINKSETELKKLLEEYESILQYLDRELYDQGVVYGRLLELMKEISDYIFKKEESVKKGIGDIVGGKVLELQTDKALREGMEKGIEQGIKAFVESYQEDKMPKDKISLRLMKNFNFTEAEAQSHIDKYWKE